MSNVIVRKSLTTNLARQAAIMITVKICNFHAKMMTKNNTKVNRSKIKTKAMKGNSSKKCTTTIIFAGGSKGKQSRGRSKYIVFLLQEIEFGSTHDITQHRLRRVTLLASQNLLKSWLVCDGRVQNQEFLKTGIQGGQDDVFTS